MLKKMLVLTGVIIALSISACAKKPTQGRSFGNQNLQQTVIVQEVLPRTLNEYVKISGIIEGKTDIILSAEISGKIIEIYKQLGDNVQKGETIAKIDNKDLEIQLLQAEASLLAAEASKEAIEKNYLSNLQLYNEKIISELEFQNSVSSYKNAMSQWQGALANLEIKKRALNNSLFISPVSGTIVDLPIRIGQTVTMNQKIAGIVDLDNLIIRTGIGESHIGSLKRNQSATIFHKNNHYPAKISGIGYKMLNTIANYPVEIELKNRNKELIPGMIVSAEILVNIHKNVFYTSLNHILKEYDQNFAFVINKDNEAVRKNLILGKQIRENVIILEGLSAGDMLVIEGYENIEQGAKVIVKIDEEKNSQNKSGD